MSTSRISLLLLLFPLVWGCSNGGETTPSETLEEQPVPSRSAAEILGNPAYQAISFGGYRHTTRQKPPSVEDLKEDMLLLDAMGINVIRTYHTQQFKQTGRLMQAIRELKDADPKFEMYVMMGAWMQCENAWTENPNHEAEDIENNQAEIEAAIAFINENPDIVKVLAVGNESMVHWASGYFVRPGIILDWVNRLQKMKASGELPKDLWITTSDNFASWGGGGPEYHNDDLNALIKAVDYVSMHTYPFHDSHYTPDYWLDTVTGDTGTVIEQSNRAMQRARDYAVSQYDGVAAYMTSLGVDKPIHIGETGWATMAKELYHEGGSRAADEYKQKLYYDHMRDWTNKAGLSCFFFEAFDEPWKDANDPKGSENHFGLIDIEGRAKYVIWSEVDAGTFQGLTRGGKTITKTYDGNEEELIKQVLPPRVTNVDALTNQTATESTQQ